MWRNLHLKWKLMVAFVGVTVLPLVITTLIISNRMSARLEAMKIQDLIHRVGMVRNLFHKLNTKALDYISLLQGNEELIQEAYFTRTVGDNSALTRHLRQLIHMLDVDELAVFGLNETLLAQAGAPYQDHSPSPSLLAQALTGQKVLGYDQRQDEIILRAAGPLTSQGETIAAVTVGFHLSTRFAEQIQKTIGAEFALISGGKVVIASHAGMRATTWTPFPNLSPDTVHMEREVHLNNTPYMMILAPLSLPSPLSQPSVIIALDKTDVRQTISETRFSLFAITTVIGVLTVLVSYGLATVIVRPVHELRQGVELLQKGDFSRPLSRQGGDEIGDLALSFNQMAAALEEKTTDLERRNRELSVLNEVAATVSQSLHLDTMLNNALDKVLALLHMESGALFLLDRSRQKLLLRTHRGLSPAATTALAALDCGESLAGYVAQTGQPLVTSNLHAESRLARDVIREEGYQVIVNVPLQAKGRVLGVLGLGSRTARQITEQELHLLIAIGNQIGVAIENAQLYENLQRQMEELKDAQRQLIQSEKMAAMGHLVSGVAHELNNPLASVIGFTELLLRREQDRTKSEETLRLIHREAMRATKIVQNLLTFSRRHKPEKRYIDINEVIEKTLELRAYAFRTHHIRVIKHLDPSLPRTMADFHQIQQVILNIFNNAEQAMLEAHGRGTLTLVTQAVTDPQAGESSLPTPCIRITISDDGPGIAEEHLRQIFDPFFTTKEAGKGTGLGLSVSYSIIQEHGGQLYASSSPGQGATFVIELPIQAQEEDLSPAPSSPASSEQVFTHKRVLVVEDEEFIRDLIEEVLQELGCTIDLAVNGRKAVEMLQRHHYDLVISDLYMPEMNGREVYAWVKTYQPELARRMVFISGDLTAIENRVFLTENNHRCLSKPFRLNDLLRIVHEVLEET